MPRPPCQILNGVERVVGVQLVVGRHVVEPGPDQAAGDGPQRDRRQGAGLAAPGLPPAVGQPHRREHPEGDQQAVGPQVQRAEVELAARRARDVGQQAGGNSTAAERRAAAAVPAATGGRVGAGRRLGTVPGMASSPPDADGAAAPGRFVATYRVQLHPGFGFDDAAGHRRLPARPRREPPVRLALPAGRRRAAPTATTWSTRPRLNRELGGRRGPRPHVRTRWARPGWARSSTWCPTTWRSPAGTTPGGGTCSKTARRASTPPTSTSTGTRPSPSSATPCCCPILGDHYGRVLEAGELRLAREGGGFVVHYYDHAAPIAPRRSTPCSRRPPPACRRRPARTPASRPACRPEPSWRASPPPSAGCPRRGPPTATACGSATGTRRSCGPGWPSCATATPRWPRPSTPRSTPSTPTPTRLDALLERQNYRLAWWRTAGQELDYRRFFDISTLVGLRVEDDQVFADSHALILEFLADGVLDGVRIDHIDGLRDPATYLARLAGAAPGPGSWSRRSSSRARRCPPRWPVAGTTGYDWLNLVGGLAVDPAGERRCSTATPRSPASRSTTTRSSTPSKRQVHGRRPGRRRQPAGRAAGRDLRAAPALPRLHPAGPGRRGHRDAGRLPRLPHLRAAEGRRRRPTPTGRARPPSAAAREPAGPTSTASCSTSSQDLLLLRHAGRPGAGVRAALPAGQRTGHGQRGGGLRLLPLPAARLAERGRRRPVPLRRRRPTEFHAACRRRPAGPAAGACWPPRPTTPSAARTSGPASACCRRCPTSGPAAVARWSAVNAAPPQRRLAGPQHRVAALPDPRRGLAHRRRADRRLPGEGDQGGQGPHLVDRSGRRLRGGGPPPSSTACWPTTAFVADLEALVGRLRRPGWINSLAQKLITLTAPGVPDLYQGSELWDLSLVDPDNRRPVDFDLRRRLLAAAGRRPTAAAVWAGEDGDGRGQAARRDPGPPVCARPMPAGSGPARRALRAAGGDRRGGRPRRRLRPGRASRSRSCPAGPRPRAAGWLGRHRRCSLPPGTWRNQFDLAGRGVARAVAGWPSCWPAFPVALLAGTRTDDRRSGCGRPSRDAVDWSRSRRPARRPWHAGRAGLVAGRRARRGPRHPVPLLARRRPAPARPPCPSQPEGIDGPSEVVDHGAFAWTDQILAGRAARRRPSSTSCTSARSPPRPPSTGSSSRLDHLVDLGVTAVELMPVAEFSGDRGWGYDGVLLYAPHHAYGGPGGLEAAGRRLPPAAAWPW